MVKPEKILKTIVGKLVTVVFGGRRATLPALDDPCVTEMRTNFAHQMTRTQRSKFISGHHHGTLSYKNVNIVNLPSLIILS